jgi:hypothetical protein
LELIPHYQLNRQISTIPQLWQEWTSGLGSGPSVLSLDSRYGTKWRSQSKETKMYSRRKRVIDGVKGVATRIGISWDASVILCETKRLGKGKSIAWLGEAKNDYKSFFNSV